MTLSHAITRFKHLIGNLSFNTDIAIDLINTGWEETAIRTGILRECTHTPLIANQYEYELDPSDIIRLVRVEISTIGEMKILHSDDLIKNDTDMLATTGTPQYCALMQKQNHKILLLSPTPDTAIPTDISEGYDKNTDGIWVWYCKNNPYITDLTLSPELPDEYATIGLHYAEWLATGNPNRLNEFDKLISERNAFITPNRIIKREAFKL